MSGPQFFRVQSFARKANRAGQSVEQVLAEAARAPAFSMHVLNPKPPRVIFGLAPEDVQARHDAMVSAGFVEVQMPDGSVTRRGVRKDRHTLLTCIASHPHLVEQVSKDPEARRDYEEWVSHNVRFFRELFGEDLVGVIEHTDETHAHLHAFVLPLEDPTCSARDLNPAWVAKTLAEEAARAEGQDAQTAVKAGNVAYRDRARDLQDQYYEAVGIPCGLTRTGPRRQRLSRAQWNAAKDAARLNRRLNWRLEARLEELVAVEEDTEAILERHANVIAEALEDVEALRAKAETELDAATTARARAEEHKIAAETLQAMAAEAVSAAKQAAQQEMAAIRQRAEEDRAWQDMRLREARERLDAEYAARLREDRKRMEAEHDARLRDAFVKAAAIVVEVIFGVMHKTVGIRPGGKGWFVRDSLLRHQVQGFDLDALEGVVSAFAEVWERLTKRLSEPEIVAERDRVQAELGPQDEPGPNVYGSGGGFQP